jgi:hypothetical protein
MKIQKKYLLFNEIFRKVTLMGSNNKFNQNESSNNSSDSNGTDFILNYRHYYNFFDELEKNISSLDNIPYDYQCQTCIEKSNNNRIKKNRKCEFHRI